MTAKGRNIIRLLSLLVLIVATAWILVDNACAPYQKMEGKIFGTYYHITYQSSSDFEKEILGRLEAVDASLSAFNENSIVSKVNRNERVRVNEMFKTVFELSQKVSRNTNGAFDVTVAPLVNLWGFGFRNKEQVSRQKVDSILTFVGWQTVDLHKGYVVKRHSCTMLDFSAIAKGYGCDVVADFLEAHGVTNFMVEIGGEIRAEGVNSANAPWTLGIEKPTEDSVYQRQELFSTIQKSSMAIATSGNYRNFYYKDGHKYAHTISPATGYPIQHKLLSATVCAPSCALADAYATAFMVLGMEEAQKVLSRTKGLDAYFIYTDQHGHYKTWCSEGLSKFINK